MTGLMERLDDIPKPAWIALLVVSFILFWPIGLALLIYLKWSGRMFCSRRRYGHWSGPDGREARRERARNGAPGSAAIAGAARGSGNVAFDEYREETLRKLDEEQREFRDFLDRLRAAKDRSEFDQFMNERRNRPPAAEPPAPTPSACKAAGSPAPPVAPDGRGFSWSIVQLHRQPSSTERSARSSSTAKA